MVRTAATGDYTELLAALLPCLGGDSTLGRQRASRRHPRHPDAAGIDRYAHDDVAELADWCRQARPPRRRPAARGVPGPQLLPAGVWGDGLVAAAAAARPGRAPPAR